MILITKINLVVVHPLQVSSSGPDTTSKLIFEDFKGVDPYFSSLFSRALSLLGEFGWRYLSFTLVSCFCALGK